MPDPNPANPSCLRCKTPMQPGFLVDGQQGAWRQARWVAGPPTPPSMMGHEVSDKQLASTHRVTSFRCPTCGLLESYAHRA